MGGGEREREREHVTEPGTEITFQTPTAVIEIERERWVGGRICEKKKITIRKKETGPTAVKATFSPAQYLSLRGKPGTAKTRQRRQRSYGDHVPGSRPNFSPRKLSLPPTYDSPGRTQKDSAHT